ncbi:MAG: hypothetical protein OXC05_12040 [Halieaceae bacterium]|nr:hypothetical protein [Halieaceae bacterium]
MAATAHSEPYSIFMRKIGYSVGLEHTLERFHDLQDLYLSNGDITSGSWKELVSGDTGWGLRTDNIADVFFALGLIQRTHGDLLVLENLDSAAIAASLLNGEKEKQTALSFVFLWAVLINDGEIFVNFLLSDFEKQSIRNKLITMIKHKRCVLAKAMPGRDVTNRISRVVTIERQQKNRGSAGAGRSVASLKRTEPLQNSGRVATANPMDRGVEFSDDYFKKVPPRRKDWARKLGLWSEGGLTALGRRFINHLRSCGYINDDDIFIFWPMDYELVRSGFKPTLFENTKTMWDALVDFGTAYADVKVRPFEQSDTDILVDRLGSMIKVYRSLHTRKSMLRRELPITIAYPASIAIASATMKPVIDLPTTLDVERRGERRRITFRPSRNTGGALSLKR